MRPRARARAKAFSGGFDSALLLLTRQLGVVLTFHFTLLQPANERRREIDFLDLVRADRVFLSILATNLSFQITS
jgi:hypothetical protein